MKHPQMEEREHNAAFRRRRDGYFLRYGCIYYGAFLLVVALICALTWPAVNKVMLLIACCSGMAVCIAIAEYLSRQRTLRELREEGVIPDGWRPSLSGLL